MSARRPLSSLLLALVASSLTGCVIAVPHPRQAVPEDARSAVSLVIARWHAFSDLRAVADVTLERNGRRDRLTGVLLAKAPASLRFEALSPFGQPFLLVTVHDGRLVAYDAAANEAAVGPATSETTARLLQLAFDPDDLVGILVGRAVPPKDLRAAEILPPDDMGPSLSMIGALNAQRVWMDFQTGIARRIQVTGGRTEVLVTYHRDGAGAVTGFDLTAAQSRVTGSVRYREVVVDGGIDPDRFTLTIPNGAKIQEIR